MDVVSPILEKAGASYVINKLIDKATNYGRDKYYWKTDLQEELQSLKRMLPQIEEVLVFAEDRLTSYGSSNPELIKWLSQFRDVMDEVEEELDELEYLELEKESDSESDSDIDPSFRPAKRFLKSDDVLERLRTCVKNLKTSASDVEKFRALVTQTGGIGTGQMQQEILLLTDQSRITSCLPVLSFKGREEEKGKIIQYLLGESVEESEIQSSENVHCLPLVAMGGMGKTALAQQVFDHFENVKKEHFDIKIWVCDSSIDLNASSLMKKILEYSTCQSESGPLELIPVKLKEELHSKRFLLVLDDVWDDKNLTEWEKLSAPLRYGQKGSWMILTTRLRSVAKMVSKVIRGTMEPIMLRDLSKDKCRSLCEPAFAGRDPNEYSPLLEIGEEIVEKLDSVQEDALPSVAEVGKLTSLQELCFTVGTESGYRIDELMNMDNLRRLSIAKLSNVQSLEEVNRVNLVRKSYLTSLKLNWDGVSSNPDLDQQEVLAALQPPCTIRELFITHYKGGRLAPWMDTQSLSRLESLELYACTSLEELPPLWKLPCLKFLKLSQMKAIRSLGCHFSGQIDIQFPVLEELRFYDLPLWEEWNGADDYIWFPHLITFEIKNCPKLKKIPDLPLSIENLCMRRHLEDFNS